MRIQSSPVADALWAALRRAGGKGLTAGEAANRKLCSEPYARRRLRVWAKAGFLAIEDGTERISHDRYRMTEDAPRTAPAVTRSEEVLDKAPAMTAAQFAAIRRKLGISATEMGQRLGWTARRNDLSRRVRRFETGARPIDAALAAKVKGLVS